MSVTSVVTANSGMSGETKGTDAATATRGHRATFRVACAAADTWDIIDNYFRSDSSLPYPERVFHLGNGHDSRSKCTGLRGTQITNGEGRWLVEATYEENGTTISLSLPGQDGQGKGSDNPFEWHDEIEVSTTQISMGVEAAVFKFVDPPHMMGAKLAAQRNKFIPVANSAGVPIDPGIEEELDMTVIRITKFQPIYSDLFYEVYVNTVNDSDITISKPFYEFTKSIPAYCGKIKAVNSNWAVTDKGIRYWRHTIEVHVNKLGWRRRLFDRGAEEVFFPEEVLPNGQTLSNSDLPNGLQFVHEAVKDLEGNAIAAPVPFNGKGKRLDIGEPFCWMVYQTLREVDWSGIQW